MKGSELTLVFFTLLMQTAIGMLLAFGLVNNFAGWKNELADSKLLNDKILFLVCAVFTAGMIISFFHLGNVKNAYYTLCNITGSWLSREILFTMIFSFLTVAFTLVYVKGLFMPAVQNGIALLAVLSGIVFVFVMAKIYMLETVPAWNTVFTSLSFYSSSLILGGLTFLCALIFLIQKSKTGIASMPVLQSQIRIILGIAALLLLAELIIWLFHINAMANGERGAVESYNIIINSNLVLFIARIVLQIAGIAFLIYLYFLSGKGAINITFLYLAYILVLLAEITGRYLFYAMYARMGV